MLTCASSGEILKAPPPKFSLLTQMARVSLLGTDYSEDKRAIAGRVFTKDQIPREFKRQ